MTRTIHTFEPQRIQSSFRISDSYLTGCGQGHLTAMMIERAKDEIRHGVEEKMMAILNEGTAEATFESSIAVGSASNAYTATAATTNSFVNSMTFSTDWHYDHASGNRVGTVTAATNAYTISTGTSSAAFTYQGIPIEYVTGTDASTYTIHNNWFDGNYVYECKPSKPMSAIERMVAIIKGRVKISITMPSRRRPIGLPRTEKERRARETLALVIGDLKYRKYLKTSMVSVQAKSGKVYVICPGHDFTSVFYGGQQVQQLCVVLKGNFPPTDSVIVRYLMILNNEQQFRDLAIGQGNHKDQRFEIKQPESKNLIQIYQSMKQAA